MRTADAFAGRSAEEPWISFTPYEASRSFVKRGIGRACQIGQTEKAGHIRVVHQELAAEAIHFIGPDRALGSLCDGMLLQRRLDFSSERMRAVCQCCIVQ